MIILGIETSCDETAAAIVEGTPDSGVKILSNVVASSVDLHAKTGGIIPEVAARQQVISMIPVLDQALTDAGLESKDVDTVAVTYGPGLIGSLLVGVETAKALSLVWNKPLVPINHLVAHIYANWINNDNLPELPALVLVVSGGHTDLVLMKNHGDIVWISGTRDDAAGEAFDKSARLLGLAYPGGPQISKLAKEYRSLHPEEKLNLFPRPLINEDTFDWSFSGLKTSVLRTVQSTKNKQQTIPELAANIEEAIVDILVDKTFKAVAKYKPKSLLLAGGVAANERLRNKIISIKDTKWDNVLFHVPEAKFCTDNGAVIATCALYNLNPIDWSNIDANPNLTITS